MKTLFIGAGNMAHAIIGGLRTRGVPAADLAAVDVSEQALSRLATAFGVATGRDPAPLLAGREVVLFAVKPQQMRAAAAAVAPQLGGQLVVSIAAGIRAGDLSRWLGSYAAIVRAMPNTPALVRSGISGLWAMPGVGDAGRALADALLGAVGETVWLAEESDLDAVTALSGSGPAYVFYLLEAMQAAGAQMGLSADAARRLSLATLAGGARLAGEASDPPEVLRARVTSKGGTTERAIGHLDAHAVKARIVEAICAARERARELGDELGRP